MSDDPPEQPENITETITPGEDVRGTSISSDGQEIKNTWGIALVLDPLRDRIEELGSTAEEMTLGGQQDTHRVIEYSPLLHEIHSLSISYLEGATVQLCRHYLETRSAPVEDILQEVNKSIVHPETEEPIEFEKGGMADEVVSEYPEEIKQQCDDILYHIENRGAGSKRKILKKTGLSSDELDDAYLRVKERRKSYVHTPEDLLDVRLVAAVSATEVFAREANSRSIDSEFDDNSLLEDSPLVKKIWTAKEKSTLSDVYDELNDVSEFDFLEVQVYDCLILSREISTMIHDHLPYEEDLYRRLRNK